MTAFDYSGTAQIITAIATMITVISSTVAAVLARRSAKALTVVSDKIMNVTEKIETVHVATNSMKDKLVALTGEKEFAAGLKEGREEKNPPVNRKPEGGIR